MPNLVKIFSGTFNLTISHFGSTTLVPVWTLDPKQYCAYKSNGAFKAWICKCSRNRNCVLGEQTGRAVGLSTLWVPEVLPLVSCTFFNTDDVSCLISGRSVTMLIVMSGLSGPKLWFSGSKLFTDLFKFITKPRYFNKKITMAFVINASWNNCLRSSMWSK